VNQHKFQRMDKGIKRPHNPDRTTISGKTILARNEKGQAVALLEPEEREEVVVAAIKRYLQGESVAALSAELNVSRGTIYNWMLGDLGPGHYTNLVTQMLVTRVRRADEMLETAEDPLNIARAREMARFARMDLERRRPHLYGQKQEVTHRAPDGPVISIVLASAPPQPVLIEGDSSIESVAPLDLPAP
jgi:hypothetical protein